MEMWRRVTIVLIGLFECLMFAGCIFGWPALLHILQTEGIYSHLCNGSSSIVFVAADGVKINGSALPIAPPKLEAENVSTALDENMSIDAPEQFENDHKGFFKCKEQDEKFGLIFTITVVLYGCPAILVGFCLDKFGLRVTRLFASSMITSGFISMAFATKEESWLVFLGFVLIGTGANPIRMCALQYANLFPAQRSTILFVYTSAHSISTLVFLIFQNAHAFGASLQTICFTAAIIAGLTFGSTFVMPCMKTEHKEDENPKKEEQSEEKMTETKALTNGGDSEKESVALSNNGKETKVELLELEKKNEPPKPVPVLKSVMTLSYAFHIFWLMNLYNLRFYITCFNPWAYKTTDDSKQVALFNQVNGIFILASPFFAPIGGMITDHLVKRASSIEDKTDRMAKTFQAPSYCLIAAATLIFCVLVCRLFFTTAAVYASLFLISLSRPMVIGSFFAYTRVRFLPEHFNRLTGIGFTLVSILSIFQYNLFKWQFSSDENYYRVIVGLMVVTVLTLISPGHILVNKLARKYAAERISTLKEN